MAGFFSVRLAPGVRLSASSRGLRAHVGPRGARVHVGGGRPGVSTGAGPVTFYESVGGRARRRTRSSTGPTTAQINAAEKQRQAQLIREALEAVESLHRQEFPVPSRPVAVAEPTPDLEAMVTLEQRKALRGVGVLQRAKRRTARERARTEAEERRRLLLEQSRASQEAQQREIDAFWTLLDGNDQDAVISMLGQVFADNRAPATAIGVRDAEVQLAVLVPDPATVIPDRVPARTAAGNVSLRRMSKSELAEWERVLVAGNVLATVKEAFASAQKIGSAAVVALRDQGAGIYGQPRMVPVLAARLTRERLSGVRWPSVTSWDVMEQASTELNVNLRGATRALVPLDLSREPDLAALVAAVDVDELA